MNSLKRTHHIMISFAVITLMLFTSIAIMRWMMPEVPFEYSRFVEEQEVFLAKVEEDHIALASYLYDNFFYKEPLEIKDSLQSLHLDLPYNVFHVRSSYRQIQDYAWLVLDKARGVFGEEVQIVGTVYALDSTLSALLNQPQSHLFFALNEDHTHIIAILAQPWEKDVELTLLWDLCQSDDVDFTRDAIEKLLILFHEVV